MLGNTHALVVDSPEPLGRRTPAGDVELALATAQESVDLSQDARRAASTRPRPPPTSPPPSSRRAQPQRAVELLLDSAGGEELVLIGGSPRARYLELLTRCWLALGRQAEAERAAAAAQAWASAVQLPMAAAWADRAAAAVDAARRRPRPRSRAALASAAAADGVGAPVEAALSRTLAGRALAEAGERDRAATELQRAARQFEACGALRYRDEAERELRKLGHRIHRRTRPGKADGTGFESLTERELQVARLVVDRKTNPEIAAELFLSQKTVETHLRNIFRKLGVSSRVELARAVERRPTPNGA